MYTNIKHVSTGAITGPNNFDFNLHPHPHKTCSFSTSSVSAWIWQSLSDVHMHTVQVDAWSVNDREDLKQQIMTSDVNECRQFTCCHSVVQRIVWWNENRICGKNIQVMRVPSKCACPIFSKKIWLSIILHVSSWTRSGYHPIILSKTCSYQLFLTNLLCTVLDGP